MIATEIILSEKANFLSKESKPWENNIQINILREWRQRSRIEEFHFGGSFGNIPSLRKAAFLVNADVQDSQQHVKYWRMTQVQGRQLFVANFYL